MKPLQTYFPFGPPIGYAELPKELVNDFNKGCDDIVKDKELSYMEAVLDYANNSEIEPEAMAKMLNQSIKDKIEVEAQELHLLKRTAKLPI